VVAAGGPRWPAVIRFRPVRFTSSLVKYRRHVVVSCSVALALGLAACGTAAHPTDADANNNGSYVRAGALTYQLQISRELNQFSVEDHQYLTGLPAGSTTPTGQQLWYGVFLWAKNYSKQPQVTSNNFDILDTQGNKYYPVQIDSSLNQYAWTAQTLEPLGTEPGPDTTASFGPTQGALLLFKLSTSVYANRPLVLEIHAPGQSAPSTISLDL
jgi:hypothetical protein